MLLLQPVLIVMDSNSEGYENNSRKRISEIPDIYNYLQLIEIFKFHQRTIFLNFKQDTVQKVLGEQRIVTPKVVEVTSEHFNCKTHETVNEFGPMLEVEVSMQSLPLQPNVHYLVNFVLWFQPMPSSKVSLLVI